MAGRVGKGGLSQGCTEENLSYEFLFMLWVRLLLRRVRSTG